MDMPFGKHRGKRLDQIPVGYLAWVLENCTNASPYLRNEIRRTLEREAESHVTRSDALCAPGLVSQWYRQLAREYHPDHGGNHDAMKAVNRGRELLLAMMEEAA